MTRDRRSARFYADGARQCLKEIFDIPSEEAASAFLCLAYYNTYSGEGLRADLWVPIAGETRRVFIMLHVL